MAGTRLDFSSSFVDTNSPKNHTPNNIAIWVVAEIMNRDLLYPAAAIRVVGCIQTE